jgi:bifunctional DNase/RNase
MLPVEVECLRVEHQGPSQGEEGTILMPDDRTYVMLKDTVGKRALNIQIGQSEAFAIASALEGQRWQRPMTHDLLGGVIAALGATLQRVLITELREGVYFAEIELTDRDGSLVTVSARPSDAIAIALRFNAPILVSESLFVDAA